MEDGVYSTLYPQPPSLQPQPDALHRKTQSLPGFYARPTSPPHSFRDAFAASYRPFAQRKPSTKGFGPQSTARVCSKEPPAVEKRCEEKKPRRFLGGLFRRRRRGSSSSSSDADYNDEHRRGFFSRKEKKKDTARNEGVQTSFVYPPPPPRDTVGVSVSAHHFGQQTTYLLATDTGKVLKMSPTGSLGRDVSSHYVMDGYMNPHSLNLVRPGVSASHDSLAASESAYGSINSSLRSSGLGRSSSTDTLSRKEKREILKARVERLRERTKGSSSEEEGASLSSQFGSENSLTKGDCFRRTRSSRTERYIRRKAQELETLRIETEKDRKNREAVQARILEIQKTQKARQEKKMQKEEVRTKPTELLTPKRSAQLLYQDSNQFSSVVISSTPDPIVPPSPKTPSRHQYVIKRLSDISDKRQTPFYGSYVLGIPPASSLDRSRPSQERSSSFNGIQHQQRSLSYDSHINKAASLPPQYTTRYPLPYSSVTPPAPPPRDSSSLLSPYEFHRPISYSFENLNKDPNMINGYCTPRRTVPSFRIEAPIPLSSPRTRGFPLNPLPLNSPCCRSYSDKYLNQNFGPQGSYFHPGRPALPKGYNPQEPYDLQVRASTATNSNTHYSPRVPQQCGGVAQPSVKVAPSIPPSPSSDYSSYVSDSSLRVLYPPGPVTTQPESSKGSVVAPNEYLAPKAAHVDTVSRPVAATLDLMEGSDTNQSSNKDHSKMTSNRPLSMVLEKAEATEKDSPPLQKTSADQMSCFQEKVLHHGDVNPLISNQKTHQADMKPFNNIYQKTKLSDQKPLAPSQETQLSDQKVPSSSQKVVEPSGKPRPPKRNSSSSIEFIKQHFEALIKDGSTRKDAMNESVTEYQQKVREFLLKEKERLEQNKSENFAEALKELENIYRSLNLQSDDILEGAEKLDRANQHFVYEGEVIARGRSRTPRPRKSKTPDTTKDDLHLRRVQLSNRNLPDATKALQNTGSYLLVSPLHGPPSLECDSQDFAQVREPDIINDDVTVKNVQRSNALKVLDPQPPFGIPLGPIPIGKRTDYLTSPPGATPSKTGPKEEPDIVTDDMAFRYLRKEVEPVRTASNKALNVTELDELIAESKKIPRGSPRSRSVPRSSSVERSASGPKRSEMQTPRKMKNHAKTKHGGKFCDSFKEALTDGEASSGSSVWRPNPSWVERANLSDTKWDSLATSTETLTELASKTSSQPDIRDAIIHEARFPSAVFQNDDDRPEFGSNLPTNFPPESPPMNPAPAPQLLRVQTVPNVPLIHVKVARSLTLDTLFNNHPKPYSCLSPDPPPEPHLENKLKPVDIATLDDLISSLSEVETKKKLLSQTGLGEEQPVSEDSVGPVKQNEKTVNAPISFEEARNKIETAIRNSIASESSGTEEISERPIRGTSRKSLPTRSVPASEKHIRATPDRKKDENITERNETEKKKLIKREEKGRTERLAESKDSKEALRPKAPLKAPSKAPLKAPSKAPLKTPSKAPSTVRPDANEKYSKVKEAKADSLRDAKDSQKRISPIRASKEGRSSPSKPAKPLGRDPGPQNDSGSNSQPLHDQLVTSEGQDYPRDTWTEPSETMVQEHRTLGSSPLGPSSLGSSPLKPIRPSPGTGDEKLEKAEQEKRDRIQRYKEERRKQMASRYGTKEYSSSDEESVQNYSSSGFRRKRRPRSGVGSSADSPETKRCASTDIVPEVRSREVEETVENHLGQQDPSSATPSQTSGPTMQGQNNNNEAQDYSSITAGREPSPDQSNQKAAQNQDLRLDSADSTLSGSEGRPPGVRRRTSMEEKDKSHKRKSHLNRASTSEEAVYPPAPTSHLSDSSEEIPRRRRRRGPQTTGSDSPCTSSPSTATSDATLRLTPPVTSSVVIAGETSGFLTKAPSLPPPALISPLRNSTANAKCDLRQDSEVSQQEGNKAVLKGRQSPKLTSTHLKAGPLRKPEIPEVLRGKDCSPIITSPGLVLKSSSLRSSSVVAEKPPSVPDVGINRNSAFRPSLRKATDSGGTCFMASRRDRMEDLRNEEDNFESLKSKTSGFEVKDHLEHLTNQALQLKSRADSLNGESVVLECEQYLKVNKDFKTPSIPPTQGRNEGMGQGGHVPTLWGHNISGDGGMVSDSGQKNWIGGPEGYGDSVWRLARQGEEQPPSPAPTSGPPYSTDAAQTFFRRETPMLTERRRSVKDDSTIPSSEKSSQGILKKSSTSKTSSGDLQESDPRPILKKKSSTEEDTTLGDPRKKSILKKKSLTDDELDWDRPRSILKGARSREDLMDRTEGVASPPTPILKRGTKEDTEGSELRPILKRRDTADGVRNLVKSDSAEGEPPLLRRDSAPLPSIVPSHGILKKRSEEPKRPRSPSLDLLTSNERPLSVAERVAGMEAIQGDALGGAKPKVRSRPSSGERPISPALLDREPRRTSWISIGGRITPPEGEAAPSRSLPEGFSSFGQPSKVSQKAAFFAKLEQEKNITPPLSPSMPPFVKKERGARFATQPITEGEVTKATRLIDDPASADASGDSSIDTVTSTSNGDASVIHRKPPSEPSSSLFLSRRMSAHELLSDEGHYQEGVKGILKTDPSRERSKDGPKSILKTDSRKSSFSEGEQPRGILKSENPLSPTKGSPEHDSRSLKSVLKKDSVTEDSKEIKSILKKESQSLEPEASSDSSSETTLQDLSLSYAVSEGLVQTVNVALVDSILGSPPDVDHVLRRTTIDQQTLKEAVKQAQPMKTKDNLAEALRQIEPLHDRSRERDREEEAPHRTTITKEEVLSHIREKALKKEGTEARPFSSTHRQDFGISPLSDEVDDDLDGEIGEMKATFEENMRSLAGLHQEMKNSVRERVTFRHKSRYQKVTAPKDRWTLNDFTPCSSKMDSSPIRSPPSSNNSSSNCSSSPPAGLRKMKPGAGYSSAPTEDEGNLLSSPAPTIGSTSAADGGSLSTPAGSSINARLLSLQKNGEEGWKNRMPKDEDPLLSPKVCRPKARPSSLLERVSLLETSSQQWKDRVTQSDATKFTVAHKMASASSVPSLIVSSSTSEEIRSFESSSVTTTEGVLSPASERRKFRTPQPKVFKSKTGSCLPEMLKDSIAANDAAGPPKDFARSISIPSAEVSKDEDEELPTVAIPRIDDDSFNAFFASSVSMATVSSDVGEFDSSDFDLITSNTSHLSVKRRSVRVARKTQTTRNPLKALAERQDLKDEYKQVTLGAGERELRRMKVEELSKSSSLAMEALAGLASRENFSAVALKRVEDNPVIREQTPYSDLMLVMVKGRRHPQVRLVKPRCESINQGDDFLLITPHELFHYKGKFANVIERAVASEMALYILQTKDMGVTSVLKVTDIEETSPTAKKERFWAKLGGSCETQGLPPGPPESDDLVEASLIASSKVFEVKGSSLVPFEEAWGQSPKYDLLSSEKVLVFDFGPEVYIWTGKRASMEDKRQGTFMVKDLWKEEFDYSDCDINPIYPSAIPGEEIPTKGSRPDWGICGKITENVETILFKEKFLDWPDMAQQTRIKEVRTDLDQKVEPVCDLEPCDVNTMISSRPEEPDLVLEMSHLGRGVVYYDEEERRLHNISTNEMKVWHIAENEKKVLAGFSSHHFFSGETYVVRWYYHVTATGRTLMGTPSRHNVTGRSRVAYFFWQGQSSSISDKGVSALMTVELDEERGPHVRVTMGAEHPAFLNLFEGGFVVHRGKREDAVHTDSSAKFFIVRGEMPEEAHLIEVEVRTCHLRSRGCVVVVDVRAGIVYLWIGAKALPHSKQVGKTAAQILCEKPAEEMGWKGAHSSIELIEEVEGNESKDFLKLIGRPSKLSPATHFSIPKDFACDWTTRVWVLEATPDSFLATEMTSPYRATDRPCAFPVWQEEIYSMPPPAIFLIDAGLKIYIWQGWIPEENPEDDNGLVTGSAFLRFTFARRAALQTAVLYVRKKEEMIKNGSFSNGSFTISDGESILNPKLVVAGMEPQEFKNLFPFWEDHEDVMEIQVKEGRWKMGEEYCLRDVLDQLCKEQYTLEELQMVPLPDGVDPSRLEKYLSDEEFKATLGVSKREFIALPSWKQLQLKKRGNLF